MTDDDFTLATLATQEDISGWSLPALEKLAGEVGLRGCGGLSGKAEVVQAIRDRMRQQQAPRKRGGLPRLKIRAESAVPGRWHVWLDDYKCDGITGLTLTLHTQDLVRAEIAFTPGQLDIDAETLAVLQAFVPKEPDAN